MENSTINFDIFSQNITPLSSYILIGDKHPESEINTFYLNNIMNKTNSKQVNEFQNIIPNKFKTTIITSIYDNKKKKEELNSELEKLEKELESSKAISKEKKTNENFLNNYDYDQKELQNDINKFEKKIKPLEQQCEHLQY